MQVMDSAFADALADWIPFSALAGAAATLLGLLLVAASLRLAVFRNPDTADVSHVATFLFASMLGAMIVPGLALLPRENPESLALPLVVQGLIGLGSLVTLTHLTLRLNPKSVPQSPGLTPWTPLAECSLAPWWRRRSSCS